MNICVIKEWEKECDGEQLFLIIEAIWNVLIKIFIFDQEARLGTSHRGNIQTLNATGSEDIPTTKLRLALGHIKAILKF